MNARRHELMTASYDTHGAHAGCNLLSFSHCCPPPLPAAAAAVLLRCGPLTCQDLTAALLHAAAALLLAPCC